MQKNFTIKKFQAIIIGSGGAGLMSAISAHDCGLSDIAVISKVLPTYSHTVSAKGGINASLANSGDDDWKFHAFDTLKGGDYLADVDAVEILCRLANEAIIELEKFGVVFSRDENGKIAQRAYGGQTLNYGQSNLAKRACYSKDKTGHTIAHTLEQQALKRGIKFFNEYFVIDLLYENKKIYGCLALDIVNGELVVFISQQTILATGGYSQIYRNTTSSSICTGDGSALVFKEGLPLQDMEFVQFHPTGIWGSGFLITEAVRSEGAYLLNIKGERFMKKYAPKMMELASRDVISQAIATEIILNKNSQDNDRQDQDHVYLDMRHIDQETLKNKLPNVVEMVKNFVRKDTSKDLIAIAPSAHYVMGGVPCNIDCEVIEGLFAVGEVACLSVHGANRLGCNSLLDLIVFGKICGERTASKILQEKNPPSQEDLDLNYHKIAINIAENKIQKLAKIFENNQQNNHQKISQEIFLSSLKNQLLENNEKCLGVFRNQQNLELGLQQTKEIYQKLRKIKIKNHQLIFNEELIEYLELENLILNSLAVYYSAINRTESRGAHYRDDFKNRDDKNFLAHSMVKIIDLEQIKMEYFLKPVKNNSLITELNLIPQQRNY
jgi:succinate dehydrogenase / fumarate reductase flavoprotein subunit